MIFPFLKPDPLLDETYANWIFDVFGWALRNLDAVMFREETVLVLPSNEHFPGRANNPADMAQLIFARVVDFSGMQHWPLQLLPPESCLLDPAGPTVMPGGLRGKRGVSASPASARLPLSYDPGYLNNPEATIAVFAHTLAHYLGSAADEPPPGGEGSWPQTTEILAVFLGFGLMFANTALVLPRGGCCGGPVVRRQAFVTQQDITYALALFASLKRLQNKQVLPHLKKSLRGHFKRARREIENDHRARLAELGELAACNA